MPVMFHVFPTPHCIAKQLSQLLIELIKNKPTAALGLATGSTMEPVYAQTIRRARAIQLDVSQLQTFNLDEYVGLPPTHLQSYNHYMHHHLFTDLGLCQQQVHLPNGACLDQDIECQNYSKAIAGAGGLDLQLLGIGSNGHIGFNEPGTPFDSLTHVVELTQKTRLDNSRFFDNPAHMPTHAITMGLREIMGAKQIILVVTGAHKSDIVAQLYQSEATPALPASVLKLHPNTQIYLDEAAATQLPQEACLRAA